MDLTNITETHDGEPVVNGMDLCKALVQSTGADPMAVWVTVGRAANEMGAPLLTTGAKGDRGAYRLADAEQITNYVLAVA